MTKAQKNQSPAADTAPESQSPASDPQASTASAEQSDEPESSAKTEESKKIKVRVLVDCEVGKCNEVVVVEEKALKSLEGKVDANPEAVAYAEGLAK